jgi:RNA polymerase sigma factor (sigma-70 family)
MDFIPEHSVWYYFKQGDKDAFESLFKRYYPLLYTYGIKISKNVDLTEDCLQSFFLYLFENRQNLGDVKSLKSYLFISFKRALIKLLKREYKKVQLQKEHLGASEFIFSQDELTAKQDIQFLSKENLHVMINNLPPREREVIFLKYYSGLTSQEIAEVMDINYQSVGNTLQKAMYKLRKKSENKIIASILNKI